MARRKAQLGLSVTDGGALIPIGKNMFLAQGRTHAQGGIGLTFGKNYNPKGDLEIEKDELVQIVGGNNIKFNGNSKFKGGGQSASLRVFSSVPLLRGVSPAELVLQGYNPDDVFKAQEEFKDRNRINDDGTTYKTGGLSRSSNYGSKKKPYPSVKSSDFAGGHRSYPIPTKADAIDALRLAGLHGRSDVKTKVYRKYPELRKKAEYGIGMIMPPNITIPRLIDSIKFDREKIHNRIPAREWKPGGQSNVDKDILLPFGMFSILNQYHNNKDNVAKELVDEANKIISNPRSSENEVNDAIAYLAHDDAKSKYLGFPQRTGMVIDSNYKPTKAKNNNVQYYKFAHQTPEYWDNQNGSVMQDLLWQKSIGEKSKHYIDPTLNKFTGYIATDTNKGDYISIYDEWDYNKAITGGGKDNVAKHIHGAKPFEIYDRIYLDDYYGISSKPKKGDYYGGYLPEVEVKPKKKEFGGNMIYTINGNVKNGLMSARPKAELGTIKRHGKTWKWDEEYGAYVPVKDSKEKESIKTTTEIKEKLINGTFNNARPQYYAEKRLPIAGSQSIAEKAGLARSGWSYADNEPISLNYIPNINLSIPDNYGKISTPRKGGSKTTTTSNSNVVSTKINSPKIDLSRVNMPTFDVSQLGNKESKTYKANIPKSGRWVGQYKSTNIGDWIGLGSNLAGTVASYFMTKNAINKMPDPVKPIMAQAAKLKTRYNVEPQLTNIREAEQMNRAAVRRNTQSSNVSLAREQRLMNEARGARNVLYGQKENIETQLINQDRLNRQSVMRDNVRTYNEYLNKLTGTRQEQNKLRISNINNLLSGLTGSVNNILGTIESRRATNNTLRAIAAANPNVDARLIGGFDYYIDPITKRKYNKNQQYVGTING